MARQAVAQAPGQEDRHAFRLPMWQTAVEHIETARTTGNMLRCRLYWHVSQRASIAMSYSCRRAASGSIRDARLAGA